jgi:subtilase family serine protease
LKPIAFLLTLGLALGAFPQTKAVNRISQAIDERETVVLPETAQPRLRAAVDQGRMDGGFQLQASIAFKRSAAQEADIETLLAEQQDPSSSNYHKWLTPEQYADRFGLSTNDVATTTAWLQAQGFKVERVARSRTQIWFTGPVSKIETVFRTEMHRYQLDGEAHFANGTPLAVPAALSGVVLGFRNLDDFRPKARVVIRKVPDTGVKANFTSSVSGNHFLIPDDFATIYDLKPLYTAGFDGTGETLVVVGQTALVSTTTPASPASDIDAFRAAAGLPARTTSNFIITQVPSSGTAVVSAADIGEASLDLEWSQGVAKGVTQNYVFVGNSGTLNVFDALHYAIDQNLAPVISISYGNCEAALGASNVQIIQGWAQQANVQGQTISAASGDFGAADCATSSTLPASGGLAVDVPGALPYVTSVGGTEFSGDAAGVENAAKTCAAATTYWAASCSLTSGGSALSYIPETTWNDTAAAGQLDGTGGGASIFFSKPSWQTGSGVPADGARDVPDIAFNASNGHDPYLLCSQGSCVNGFRLAANDPSRPNGLTAAGGTSFGAPAFAGVVAILNQKTGSRQGNVNPNLYAVAATTPNAFHDITTGNNIVPCGAGTPNCPTTGTLQYGFSAGAGYDQVTGLGTLDVNTLANAWNSGSPTAADFSMFAGVVGISAPGGQATSTITIDGHNGFSGAVALSCTAPASALITCSLSSSSVTPSGTNNTGTATLTVKTTAAATLERRDAPLAPLFTGSGAVLAGVFLFGISGGRRNWGAAATLLAIAFLLSAVGCGGSSSPKSSGTPVGSYTVTVTGTSGTTTHTTNVSVSVQ